MLLTWANVGYTFLIALGLSLLFGAYPALRAARLDPIVALRSV
jgi:ABC-type antimicrobial peptide transport system permease subunit